MSQMRPIPLPEEIDETFEPQNEAEMLVALQSWRWRMFSGRLYKITTKGDLVDSEGNDLPEDYDAPEIAVPFVPNSAQRMLFENLHNRNVIPKARQLGMSTAIEIFGLDQALFNPDQECVVIAHTREAATKLYRKKVCFAYDNLPDFVKEAVPTTERTQTQMVFANGSSIEVTSSARGGTPHFLHVSEMGKIAAKYPDKALEITTGSLQGVPLDGMVFIESSAEGQAGEFYDICKRAERRAATESDANPLLRAEYRFHFFAWWVEPNYRLSAEEARRTKISPKEHEYFDTIEGKMDVEIDLRQRAWYIAKRDNDFATKPDMMWREYPSTPDECWQASTEGKYLAVPLAIARREGRIGKYPVLRHVPVNSFWDLGASDDTAIWLHQRVGPMDRFFAFHEQSGAGYLHFIHWMESHQLIWGAHYLPHDAEQKRQQRQMEEDPTKARDNAIGSPVMILRETRPTWTWHVVPRVQTIQHGIDLLRIDMATYCFDEEGCKEGLVHLENYSREWNNRLQVWSDHPRHDQHSHATDAIRQKAQGYSPDLRIGAGPKKPTRARATGFTA